MANNFSRILIIGEDKDVFAFFEKELKPDYKIFSTSSKKEITLNQVAEAAPDIIILVLEGDLSHCFQLCRELKSDRRTCQLPVIFVSDSIEEKKKAFEAGGYDFMIKPLLSSEIKIRLDTHINSTRLERQLIEKTKNLSERINEIKRIDVERWDLTQKIEVLMQYLPIGIVLTAPDGEILNANPEMLNLLGYDSLESISDRVIQSFYYDEKDRQKFIEKMESGKVENFEVRFRKSDGSIIWCNISSVRQGKSRKEEYFLSSIKDVTEKKKIEEEKANLLIQLTQTDKMASIGQLAAGVAHEINNPVGFVTSNLNTLTDYLLDLKKWIHLNQSMVSILPDTSLQADALNLKTDIESLSKEIDLEFMLGDIDELMSDCKEGLDRIKKIVIDLKDFAHPGKSDAEPVNINSGIESTLNVVSNEIKYKATVYKEFSDIPPVKGIPQQINQVFLNIIVNAAQAMEQKGEIRIKTLQDDCDVVVEIEDTGRGIPEENLNKIFDPFFTTKEVGKGTGLGMNIAYNIIKQHRGDIRVESDIGKGSRFIIRLPALEDKE